MEIPKLNQQMNDAIAVNRTCVSENKTKCNCGYKIILPVIGFECYLCKVFIRNENDIEDHVASIQHLKIYEIHLLDHSQVEDSIEPIQNSVNGQWLEDQIPSFENDAAENSFEKNLVNGTCPGESDAVGSNIEEPETKETDFDRINRELTNNILTKSKTNGKVHSKVDDGGISTINAHLNIQNAQPNNCQIQGALGNVIKHHFDESDRIARGSSERCNTLIEEEERGGRFEGIQVKIEGNCGNRIELNSNVSATKEQTKDNALYDNVKVPSEGNQEAVFKTFIKEEKYDDYYGDDGDAGGIIGGFLEDNVDDLHDHDVHCNGELMSGYTSDHELQTESTRSCTATILTSDDKWQPTVSPLSKNTQEFNKIQEFNETSKTTNSEEMSETGQGMNMEIYGDINSNINTCISTEHPQTGSYKGCKNALSRARKDACKVLGKSFKPGGNLEVHQRLDTEEKPYSCDKCEMKFPRSDKMKRHRIVHTGRRPFSCNLCGKSFKQKATLQVHQRMHTGEKPYSCNECGKSFKQKATLQVHERKHTGEKPYSCSECGKSFKQKATLQVHERMHTGEKPYSCNECEKSYGWKRDLIVHKRIHTGEKPFLCNVCGKSFRRCSSLKVHERVHTGERPFPCKVCGKLFQQRHALTGHEMIHTGEKPYSCNVCGKSFRYKGDISVHKRIHTGAEPYSCNVCGKPFNQASNLKVHKRIHTGEKPFPCNECGKSFKAGGHLKAHKSVHTGCKPYSCKLCGKSFREGGNLKKHQVVHTAATPFCCNICGKSFKRRGHLKRHKKTHAGE